MVKRRQIDIGWISLKAHDKLQNLGLLDTILNENRVDGNR